MVIICYYDTFVLGYYKLLMVIVEGSGGGYDLEFLLAMNHDWLFWGYRGLHHFNQLVCIGRCDLAGGPHWNHAAWDIFHPDC